MKKSAKNYIVIVTGILLVYFMFVGILSASEIRTAAITAAPGTNPPTDWWRMAVIVVCGIGAFICFAYEAVSRGNRHSWKVTTHSMRSKLILILSAITGGVFSLLMATAMIGSLPPLKFSSPQPVAVNKPKKPVSSQQASSSQSSSSKADTQESEEPKKPADGGPVENATGVMTIADAQTISQKVLSDQRDQSVILGKDLSSITLSQSIIEKNGDTTDVQKTLDYGVNAAVLAGPGSTLNALGSSISTHAIGAPGIVISGENATASITDTDIATTGGSSPVLMALQSGQLHITGGMQRSVSDTSPIYYVASSSSISAESSVVQTDSEYSPVLYNASNFTGNQLSATSTVAPTGILMPGSSTTLTTCTLNTGAYDTESGMEGVFLFRNDLKLKTKSPAELSLSGCAINFTQLATHPGTAVFYTRETDANITLNANPAMGGFNTLMRVSDSKVNLNASAQTFFGVVITDEKSEVNMTLTNGSVYNGGINNEKICKKATLHMDASSVFSLSQDTYLTEFKNDDASNSNIQTNGYHLYVNGKQVL